MIKLRPVISRDLETGQKQYFESLREVENYTYIDKRGIERPFRPSSVWRCLDPNSSQTEHGGRTWCDALDNVGKK